MQREGDTQILNAENVTRRRHCGPDLHLADIATKKTPQTWGRSLAAFQSLGKGANLRLNYIRAMEAAAEVVIIERPHPRTAGPVRPELEILVLAQAFVVMADAALYSG